MLYYPAVPPRLQGSSRNRLSIGRSSRSWLRIPINGWALIAVAATGVAQDRGANVLPRVATALSVTPSSGNGHAQNFITRFTSTAAGGVRHAYFWLGGSDSAASPANSCQLHFAA